MHLHNQTILVTGAASGIGKALSRELAGRDNRIVAVARNQDKLKALQHELPSVTAMPCDLKVKEDVIDLVRKVEDDGFQVSVLINNAAIQNTPFLTDPDFDFDGIEREITTNFTAVAWLTALLLPALSRNRQDGAVVNISSGLALYPKTSSSVYCATKAAVHSLSQSLRYQLVSQGIAVHEVLLPLVDTSMTAGRGRGKITPERAAADIISGIEKGREEIYVGKAKLLRLLNRISPALTRNILRRF